MTPSREPRRSAGLPGTDRRHLCRSAAASAGAPRTASRPCCRTAGRGDLCSGRCTVRPLLLGRLLTMAAGRRDLCWRQLRMSLHVCGQVLLQVVDGVSFVHAGGIIHLECAPVPKHAL